MLKHWEEGSRKKEKTRLQIIDNVFQVTYEHNLKFCATYLIMLRCDTNREIIRIVEFGRVLFDVDH